MEASDSSCIDHGVPESSLAFLHPRLRCLCVCVCVCVHTSMCACTGAYCMCACVWAPACACACVHVRVHGCMGACTWACAFAGHGYRREKTWAQSPGIWLPFCLTSEPSSFFVLQDMLLPNAVRTQAGGGRDVLRPGCVSVVFCNELRSWATEACTGIPLGETGRMPQGAPWERARTAFANPGSQGLCSMCLT